MQPVSKCKYFVFFTYFYKNTIKIPSARKVPYNKVTSANGYFLGTILTLDTC